MNLFFFCIICIRSSYRRQAIKITWMWLVFHYYFKEEEEEEEEYKWDSIHTIEDWGEKMIISYNTIQLIENLKYKIHRFKNVILITTKIYNIYTFIRCEWLVGWLVYIFVFSSHHKRNEHRWHFASSCAWRQSQK